ncbi:CRISPR-associated endonuclease Cas2 [bacterium]|jgi:hypothetical protein|nr:CRISPR-associated endonuclease Cas2 [bacterium]
MNCYIVSYDGENPTHYYAIFKTLKKCRAISKLHTGMWVILSKNTLMQIHEQLKKVVGNDESILIYQVGRKSLDHWQNHPAIKQAATKTNTENPMVYGKV